MINEEAAKVIESAFEWLKNRHLWLSSFIVL